MNYPPTFGQHIPLINYLFNAHSISQIFFACQNHYFLKSFLLCRCTIQSFNNAKLRKDEASIKSWVLSIRCCFKLNFKLGFLQNQLMSRVFFTQQSIPYGIRNPLSLIFFHELIYLRTLIPQSLLLLGYSLEQYLTFFPFSFGAGTTNLTHPTKKQRNTTFFVATLAQSWVFN